MKASEARTLTELRQKDFEARDQTIYDQIMKEIETKIKTSDRKVYQIYWSGKMTDFVKERLIKDGFKVKSGGSMMDTWIEISWEKAGDTNWQGLRDV